MKCWVLNKNSNLRELTHAGSISSFQLGVSKNCWVKSRILWVKNHNEWILTLSRFDCKNCSLNTSKLLICLKIVGCGLSDRV